MAVTSPDNIWTPDLGDEYALTTDLAATADTIQDALNTVRGEIPAPNYQVGTDAQRVALSGGDLFEGLTWFSTDTSVEWRYQSGAWSRSAGGHAVRPYGTAGAAVAPASILFRSGRYTGTTSAGGVLTMPFNPVFPTACIGVLSIANQNLSSVLVEGSANANQAQFFFAGSPSVSRNVDYIAWGY